MNIGAGEEADRGEVERVGNQDLGVEIDLDGINGLNNRAHMNILTGNDSAYSEICQELGIDSKYHNEMQFCTSLSKSGLNIASLNIRSLPKHFISLKQLIDSAADQDKFIDIIGLQETNNFYDDKYHIDGYTLLSNTRQGRKGGGTALYVNKNFVSSELKFAESFIQNLLEATITKIEIPKFGKIIVANIYHPPSQPRVAPQEHFQNFTEALTSLLDKISDFQLPIIIMGDFNVNLLNGNSENATLFLDTMVTFGHIPYITRATRVEKREIRGETRESSSLIDNIFVSDIFDKVSNSGVLINSMSDHFIPFLSLDLRTRQATRPSFIGYRCMDLENKELFKEALSNRGWHEVLDEQDTNTACNRFSETFFEIFDICFPVQRKRCGKKFRKKNDFMTRGLMISQKKKNKLESKAIQSNDPAHMIYFKRYRNLYFKLVKKARKLHFSLKIINAGKNAKEIWNCLKEAINMKKGSSEIGPIRQGNNIISDDKAKANLFNEFFSRVGEEATRDLPPPSQDFRNYLGPQSVNSIIFTPVCPYGMIGYIKSLKPKNSLDINDISTRLLQFVAEDICIPLTHIFNLSIEQGVFPENFKISKTIPIFKSGDHLVEKNYRGVSLIDNIGKIFEKILSIQMQTFLDNNDFFSKNQFGFRKGFSTSMAVLKVNNFITQAQKDGHQALAIFMDVAKAFDSVDRNILLAKLEHAGIRGVANSLLRSYFENRKMKTCVNGVYSENLVDISIGVLQGSILGVLLFLIFINDLENSCQDLLAILFADDCTGLVKAPTINELIVKANTQIDLMFQWYNANRLAIHPSKSRCMIFYPPSRLPNLPRIEGGHYFPLYLNYNTRGEGQFDITKVKLIRLVPNADETTFKLLGVLLDCNLSFKQHIKAVQGKITRAIFSINQMKNFLEKPYLKLMLNAYVSSHINYGSCLFTSSLQTTLKPLEILLKKAVRIVCGKGRFEHTPPLFKELGIFPLKEQIMYNVDKLMHKFIHKTLPKTFDKSWKITSEVSRRVTRNSGNLYIPHFHLEYFRRQPFFAFPRLWNEVPLEIRNIEDEHIFSKQLRSHIFDSV